MDDLDLELEEGQTAAKRLARHLANMGGSAAFLTVWVDDEKYDVEVRHVPVVLENDVDLPGPSV
jgi:hypothetical protein